jgi:MFS family permease
VDLPEPTTEYRWRWQVLAVVLAAEAMDILDTTTVNVAGPSVRRSIGGGTDLVQWLSVSYTLAFAVLLITGGRLGDRHGRRRMFLLGAAGSPSAPSTPLPATRRATAWSSPLSPPPCSP